MLQAYSALATEHHLWRHDDPRHGGSADRRWSIHPAQRRRGKRLPESEHAYQSHVSPQRPRPTRSAGGGLQPDESRERGDTQRQLRTWRVSVQPIANVRPDHRCRRTQVVSVWRARSILRSARDSSTSSAPQRNRSRSEVLRVFFSVAQCAASAARPATRRRRARHDRTDRGTLPGGGCPTEPGGREPGLPSCPRRLRWL